MDARSNGSLKPAKNLSTCVHSFWVVGTKIHIATSEKQ